MFFRGFLKSSLIEWPGKICAVVFVGGCNFRCPFCYNRDLVLNSENLPKISQDEVLNYLQEYRNWIDGLMITGGEATILFEAQGVPKSFGTTEREDKIARSPKSAELADEGGRSDNLLNFIKKVKEMGLGLGIETNGSNPEAVEYLIKNNLVDYLAMDVKAPLKQEKYNQLAGAEVPLDKIKESIKLIMERAPDYEFRTTIVPNLLTEDDILSIAQEIRGAKKYYLQQFQLPTSPGEHLNDPGLGKLVPYPREFFENLREKIKNYFEIFSIRI